MRGLLSTSEQNYLCAHAVKFREITMCITAGSNLYVRRDNSSTVINKLPELSKTKVSPAQHMNYGGAGEYNESGYLSLFHYDPKQLCAPDGRNIHQAAAYAMSALYAAYIHFFFIPAAVAIANLNEDNVRSLPSTGRTPSLLETSQCSPPARINEDGDVVAYANRYICEFLYTGQWAQGIKVITERADSSKILALMQRRVPLNDISDFVEKAWPCNPGNGGPGGGSGTSGGSGIAV
jgi:hypothetical protein